MDRKPISPVEPGTLTPVQAATRLAFVPSPLGDRSGVTSPSPSLGKVVENLRSLGLDDNSVDLILTVIEQFAGRTPSATTTPGGLYAELASRISRLEETVRGISGRQESRRPHPPVSAPGEIGDTPVAQRRFPEVSGASSEPPPDERPLPTPDTISMSEVNGRRRSPYLDAEEAAAYLGISIKSLYGIVERGRLVPLRGPRRRYRFTTAMLDEYLARREVR